jgi:large subunit ribosomal protein L23
MKQPGLKNDLTKVLTRPRITEKAATQSASGVYTFDVSVRATKAEVKKAVEQFYKVKPAKVHMIAVPSKAVFMRGKRGTKSGGKKALVYLKKGDKIEFI